jgi:hypothetical protein
MQRLLLVALFTAACSADADRNAVFLESLNPAGGAGGEIAKPQPRQLEKMVGSRAWGNKESQPLRTEAKQRPWRVGGHAAAHAC